MEISVAEDAESCKVLTIRTYPHLKKFIQKFYKSETDGTVRVDMHSSLGITMSKTLISKRKIQVNKLERATEELTLKLNQRISKLSLHPLIAHQFNIEMDRIFKDHLVQWILSQETTALLSASESIRSFQKYYRINESEYSFENMRRHYTRWKNDEYYRKRKALSK